MATDKLKFTESLWIVILYLFKPDEILSMFLIYTVPPGPFAIT